VSGTGSYVQRKARLRAALAHASADSLAVYSADKVAKVRELLMTLARDRSAAVNPETAASSTTTGRAWRCSRTCSPTTR